MLILCYFLSCFSSCIKVNISFINSFMSPLSSWSYVPPTQALLTLHFGPVSGEGGGGRRGEEEGKGLGELGPWWIRASVDWSFSLHREVVAFRFNGESVSRLTLNVTAAGLPEQTQSWIETLRCEERLSPDQEQVRGVGDYKGRGSTQRILCVIIHFYSVAQNISVIYL